MYILDTDHISLLDRGGVYGANIRTRLFRVAPDDISICVISYEEQIRGWTGAIASARTVERQIPFYRELERLLRFYCITPMLPFDMQAAAEFQRLQQARIRIGTMDLKIAAIALVNDSTVLTRNASDYSSGGRSHARPSLPEALSGSACFRRKERILRTRPAVFVDLQRILILLAMLLLGRQAEAELFTFQHSANNPVVASGGGNPWKFLSANPTAIQFRGKIFFYFRGIAVPGGPSTISVWTSEIAGFNGVNWNKAPTQNPILAPGPADSYDPNHIENPDAVVFQNKVYLYYMAVKNGIGNICLATSTDGFHFIKRGEVLRGAGTSGSVVNPADGKLYLFFSHRATNNKGWEYRVTPSVDGITFNHDLDRIVLQPSGKGIEFDAQSLSTVRILHEGNYFYMTYAGCPTTEDYPEAIGLARSTDLYKWERYPIPICLRGPTGSWNEGAMWSGALLNVNHVYYLWYEGCGTNAGAGTNVSNQARNTSYGAYGSGSFSQIGLATYQGTPGALTDWNADFSPRSYSLQNRNSDLFLEVAGAQMTKGASVVQFSWWGGDNQKWRIERVNGFYKIMNVQSGLVLETGGGSQFNGGVALQWTWGATPNQQWHLVPLGGGNYHIVNRWSGMSLEVAGKSMAPSAVVDQWTWWGGENQMWKLAALP